MDSVYSMQKKCLEIIQEPIIYVKAAGRFIDDKKHLDSAEYYLKKAVPLFQKSPADQKALTLLLFGDLYTEKKEYQKALDFYFQSLAISQKMKRKDHVRNGYERISKTFKALNNQEKAEEYFKNYSFLNDSINAGEKKVLYVIVEKLSEEKKQEKRDKTRLYILISVISIVFLGLFLFLRKAYFNKQRKKDDLIEQKDELLGKKDELIEIQSQETDLLKKKVNDAFPQLIKLAKSNDPFFITRFKEVYPEFYEKLMSQYPDLKDSEVKICAFIRLNLTNKEIGQYENITLRAVETRKYRLKKKLGLAPDADFIKWIQEL
jgi:DNA-binding CsgD family transcriptional regulator